jgi:OOP family OmpA-OmpF porin
MEYLISTDIAPKSFTYEGQGETKPIASNNTTSGRARNRRVEFKAFY